MAKPLLAERDTLYSLRGIKTRNRNIQKTIPMKRIVFTIIKPAMKALIGVERRIFFATGHKMAALRAYHAAEARHIQRLLDSQHGTNISAAA